MGYIRLVLLRLCRLLFLFLFGLGFKLVFKFLLALAQIMYAFKYAYKCRYPAPAEKNVKHTSPIFADIELVQPDRAENNRYKPALNVAVP